MDGGRHAARSEPAREGGWYHTPFRRRRADAVGPPATDSRLRRRPDGPRPSLHTAGVTAIVGGLGAALLWAIATLCSSRSSRMLGSRVVLAWIMIVGVVVGVPIAAVSPPPASLEPSTLGLLLIAGVCYVIALQITYAALKVGKVSIVAPIVATEGATGAVIAVLFGASLSVGAALMLGVIVVGVVLSTLEPDRKDVPAGDFDVVADAIDEPSPKPTRRRARSADHRDPDRRRSSRHPSDGRSLPWRPPLSSVSGSSHRAARRRSSPWPGSRSRRV